MEDSNLRAVRLEKLKTLKELGIDPYPAFSKRTHTASQALKAEGEEVSVTGRLFSFREHGNIAFADLKDESGKIQIFFQKKLLGEDAYKQLRLLDIGDFIQVEGQVVKTVAGEISVAPKTYTLLTKSLLPLPSEYFGLKDPEIKLRKRYLDLLMHPDLRETFQKKTIFWQTIRNYMIEHGFLEVETPVLQSIPGGADARPFITHHNAQDMDLYLRISLELPLKRLLVGGFEKVFEIGRIFRNEGIDDEHLQDYTQLEFYWAYADYNQLMDLIQEMYQKVIEETFGSLTTAWNGEQIHWGGNWPRVEYTALLNEHWGVDIEAMSVLDLYALAEKLNVPVEPNLGKGRLLDYIYKKTIRPKLIQPMFVTNHPVEVEPLAKRLPHNPQNVQRMQVLAMGSELGKGFSELNDPLDQRERFEEQMKLREAGDEEAQMMDEDFVEALEYGMPPAAGFGVSERLFAMLVDKPVREMVFFPTMRPEKQNEEKKSNPASGSMHDGIDTAIFSIEPRVKETYPSVSVGVAVIEGVTIEELSPTLEKEKEEVLSSLEHLTTEQIGQLPEIISYRKLYKQMGVDWHSRRPSPEALLRRITLKKGLSPVNSCVDAYNLIVLKHHVSVGAFDYDQLVFPTLLRFPREGEAIVLLGDDNPTLYKPTELSYFDQIGGFNLDFNYRDAKRTAVNLSTKKLYINVDGIDTITPEKVAEVLQDTCNMIIKYCGGKVIAQGIAK